MRPVVFVCVHNADLSRMAEVFFNRLARERGAEAVDELASAGPGL